jgi:hypothetical protein
MAVVASILIMQQVEPNPSANEDSATADLQPETAQEPQTLSEEAPADKDEETTSQYSTELKESPVLADKVRLNLLLVSGRKLILEVEKNDTITQVKGLVLKQWPTGDYRTFLSGCMDSSK